MFKSYFTRKNLIIILVLNVLIAGLSFMVFKNEFLFIRNFIFIELYIIILVYFYRLVKTPTQFSIFLLIFLPINNLINIILFHFFDISGFYLNLFKMWKDFLLFFALAYWLFIFIKDRKTVKLLDKKPFIFISLFLLLEILYVVLPIGPASFSEKLYAFRTDTFYVFFFYLGLLIPSLDFKKIMKILLYISLLFASVSILERVINPIPFLIWLGLPDYTLYMTGGLPLTQGGLPYTFWASGGIRRVGSILLNPLDLASFSLFALPTIFLLEDTKKKIIAALLLILSIVFSISRMPILILMLLILLYFIMKYRNHKKILFWGFSSLFAIGVLIVFSIDKLRNLVVNTLTFKESSAQGHLHEWIMAIENLINNPFGMGLATSGSAGARFGNFGGGENQYLILGVQFGWIGLAMFILILVSSTMFIIRTYKKETYVKLWVGSTFLVLILSGFTQQSFLNLTLTCLSFMSLGFLTKEGYKDEKQLT